MNNGYTFRQAVAADIPRLAKLGEETYPGGELSDENFLHWEYGANPDGNAIISVAEKQGDIAAQYVVLPRNYMLDGKLINASVSVNTLTSPAHRGRGLFPKLAEKVFGKCSERNITFTTGIPNANSFPVFTNKLSFAVAGHLPLLVRPLNLLKLPALSLLSKKPRRGASLSLDASGHSQAEISECTFADDRKLNDFLDEFHVEKIFLAHRSMGYLRWRYKLCPTRKYHAFSYTEEGTLKGIIILRPMMIGGIKTVVINELFALIPSVVETLTRFASRLARANGFALMLATFSTSSAEYGTLKSCGFYRVPPAFLPSKMPVILRMHDDHLRLPPFEKWFLTFGDYDIF